MMFWYGNGLGWWGYAGMGIGMLLFSTLVIVGIVVLIRSTSGAAPYRRRPVPPTYAESPEQILAARFARGEIDQTEYRQRLGVLTNPDHLPPLS